MTSLNDVHEVNRKEVIAKMRAEREGRVVVFFKASGPGSGSQFETACAKVKIPATKRQASKWLRHKGLAYKEGRF
jgi:hypothetical protein